MHAISIAATPGRSITGDAATDAARISTEGPTLTQIDDHQGTAAQRAVFWERTFREGMWDYQASLDEAPRFALVAGYVHRLVDGGAILDAGCGEGLLAGFLDRARIRYTGFDVSVTAVDRARKRYPDLDVFPSSIEDFRAPEGTCYDAVVFNEVLSTVERPIEALQRFFTYVRPGGYVIISQFQNADPTSNAHASTLRLEQAFAEHRHRVIATTDTSNRMTRRTWRAYCLAKGPGAGEAAVEQP